MPTDNRLKRAQSRLEAEQKQVDRLTEDLATEEASVPQRPKRIEVLRERLAVKTKRRDFAQEQLDRATKGDLNV